MLKQGMVKPSSPLGERDREGGVGKNTLNAILQAVKAACCHGTYVHSDRQTDRQTDSAVYYSALTDPFFLQHEHSLKYQY